jgi:hypothetical protein
VKKRNSMSSALQHNLASFSYRLDNISGGGCCCYLTTEDNVRTLPWMMGKMQKQGPGQASDISHL